MTVTKTKEEAKGKRSTVVLPSADTRAWLSVLRNGDDFSLVFINSSFKCCLFFMTQPKMSNPPSVA